NSASSTRTTSSSRSCSGRTTGTRSPRRPSNGVPRSLSAASRNCRSTDGPPPTTAGITSGCSPAAACIRGRRCAERCHAMSDFTGGRWMMKLPLTLIERILLANQLRILEKLEPEEGETYRVAREAIEEGYELDYDLVARQLSTDTMSEDECRFVHDVLEMYRHLTFSAKRADVPAEEIQFPGFDGN